MARTLPQTNRSLPIALLRARERVMGPIREMLSDVGITEQQWRVLRVLEEEGPMEPTRISDQACLLLPSLTRILQKLEEKHLISREKDARDKRKQVVTISGSGKKLILDNKDRSVRIMNDLRQRMGSERYEELLDLLSLLDEFPAKTAAGG